MTTTRDYPAFVKQRVACLKNKFPHYSYQTLRSMANDEWKNTTGCGAGITNRLATLKYEVKASLIKRIPKFDITLFSDTIIALHKSHMCIYCNTHVKRKGKGDHIIAVQGDAHGQSHVFSNFSSLTFPCCSSCNTARGNKEVLEFVKSDVKYQNNMTAIHEIVDTITNNIEYYDYEVDMEKLRELETFIAASLEHMRTTVESMSIRKKE